MAYSNLIPSANERISISQSEIQTNFAAIKTLIDVNHYDFAEADDLKGKHIFCSMPVQETVPSIINGKEVGLYCSKGVYSKQPEITVIKANTTQAYTFTETSFYQHDARYSWTRLPSGALLQWGVWAVNQINYALYETGTIQLKIEKDNIPSFKTISNVRLSGIQRGGSSLLYIPYFVNDSFDIDAQTFDIKLYNLTRTSVALGGVLGYYLIIGT